MTTIKYGRDVIGRFKCDGKRYTFMQRVAIKTKRYLTMGAIACVFMWALTGALYIGMANAKESVIVHKEIVEVPSTEIPPVLMRIAKCESGATHYRNGQVIFNANTNKTVDIGFFQINSIHSKQASAMGLDLTDESDNIEYGLYLYSTLGTEPWYSSRNCWNK